MDAPSTKVAKRLKEVFEKSDKTYNELETETGISKSALQRYVSGSTVKIPLDAVIKIATAMNLSISWLMGWDDEEDSRISIPMQAISYEFAICDDEDIKVLILRILEHVYDMLSTKRKFCATLQTISESQNKNELASNISGCLRFLLQHSRDLSQDTSELIDACILLAEKTSKDAFNDVP